MGVLGDWAHVIKYSENNQGLIDDCFEDWLEGEDDGKVEEVGVFFCGWCEDLYAYKLGLTKWSSNRRKNKSRKNYENVCVLDEEIMKHHKLEHPVAFKELQKKYVFFLSIRFKIYVIF